MKAGNDLALVELQMVSPNRLAAVLVANDPGPRRPGPAPKSSGRGVHVQVIARCFGSLN
jgi:hypothetical protein